MASQLQIHLLFLLCENKSGLSNAFLCQQRVLEAQQEEKIWSCSLGLPGQGQQHVQHSDPDVCSAGTVPWLSSGAQCFRLVTSLRMVSPGGPAAGFQQVLPAQHHKHFSMSHSYILASKVCAFPLGREVEVSTSRSCSLNLLTCTLPISRSLITLISCNCLFTLLCVFPGD